MEFGLDISSRLRGVSMAEAHCSATATVSRPARANHAAGPTPRGICEFDLRPTAVAHVELVETVVASVSSMFRLSCVCLPCLSLSIAAGTMPRQQSAERKVDYRHSRLSRCNDLTNLSITSLRYAVSRRQQWIRASMYRPAHFSSGNN